MESIILKRNFLIIWQRDEDRFYLQQKGCSLKIWKKE